MVIERSNIIMHLYFLTSMESIRSTYFVAVVTRNSQVEFVASCLSFRAIQTFITDGAFSLSDLLYGLHVPNHLISISTVADSRNPDSIHGRIFSGIWNRECEKFRAVCPSAIASILTGRRRRGQTSVPRESKEHHIKRTVHAMIAITAIASKSAKLRVSATSFAFRGVASKGVKDL